VLVEIILGKKITFWWVMLINKMKINKHYCFLSAILDVTRIEGSHSQQALPVYGAGFYNVNSMLTMPVC